MIHDGISQRRTATELKTSRYFVQNVLADYDRRGCSLPHMKVQPERRVMTPDVMASIEIEKLVKPSIYSAELQDRLLLDGILFFYFFLLFFFIFYYYYFFNIY